jgi:hypothetical protein
MFIYKPLAAPEYTDATRANYDQPAHLHRLVMVCTVHNLDSRYFIVTLTLQK